MAEGRGEGITSQTVARDRARSYNLAICVDYCDADENKVNLENENENESKGYVFYPLSDTNLSWCWLFGLLQFTQILHSFHLPSLLPLLADILIVC